MVGGACRKHLRDDFLVARHALHLIKRTFVVVKTEPVHAVDDRLHRLGRGAFEIGIFDAQNESAAMATRIGPRVERGTGAANVEVTGGAGGEAGADGHGYQL